jgi:hypothetical protein
MANVPLIDEGTGNGGGRVHDGRGATLTASPGDRLGSLFRRARRRRSRHSANLSHSIGVAGNLDMFGAVEDSHVEIPGSRPASAGRAPERLTWAARQRLNIFSYPPLTASLAWIKFSSVLPHREGRSRSSRSRGGMRWTPEMRRHAVWGDVCLRAGRICASTVTGRRRPTFGWKDSWTV